MTFERLSVQLLLSTNRCVWAMCALPVGHPPVVFSTVGNRVLCEKVVAHLSWTIGKVSYRTFANGEISVKLEQSVANYDVFVLCSRDDLESEVNFMITQLLILLDALKSEAPERITVVLPCLEYARQDCKFEAGEPMSLKLLLHLMVTAGADRFITLDLHNRAAAGFSPAHVPLDELPCHKYLSHYLRAEIENFQANNTLVCAVDAGDLRLARKMADELEVGLMMANRFRGGAGEVSRVKLIADTASTPDRVIILDDMFDTCGSLGQVVEAVQAFAPEAKIYAVATHAYFSADACDQIKNCVDQLRLEWVAVTNSISQRRVLEECSSAGIGDRLKVVDISRLIAGAIIRIHLGVSVQIHKFRQLGPNASDPLLAEAAKVPTSQYTLKVR